MKLKFLPISIPSFFIMTGISVNAQSWSLTGNSGINASTNFLGTTNNRALILRTNNVERMRIISSGKIGIGTTGPQALLSVANSGISSLSSTGSFIIGDQTATNLVFDYKQIQARYSGQGATLFLNHLGGSVSIGSYNGAVFPAIWTNTDGRVGIGTNYALATGYALTVEPSLSGNGITVNDPGNGYSLYTVKTGNTGAAIHVEAENTYTAAIEMFTKNAQRACYGEDYLNGNGVEGRSNGGNGVVGFSTVNVGVLGIAPAYAGYFDGDVYASGTYFGSDQKLKQNINDFSSAMNIIDQLHPKNYEYRHDGNYKLMNLPNGMHYGLIAQDVEKVLPGLVKETKFDTRYARPDTTKTTSEIIDFKALNYTELIPIMVKGMQELQAINDRQEQQIEQQQKQIDDLKKMIIASPASKISAIDYASAYLQQNTPNPFSQNTVIYCYVPSSAKQAQLNLYSNDGKALRSYTLNNSGINEITLNANVFSPGEYTYSLLIGGKKIDSKKMILTK